MNSTFTMEDFTRLLASVRGHTPGAKKEKYHATLEYPCIDERGNLVGDIGVNCKCGIVVGTLSQCGFNMNVDDPAPTTWVKVKCPNCQSQIDVRWKQYKRKVEYESRQT